MDLQYPPEGKLMSWKYATVPRTRVEEEVPVYTPQADTTWGQQDPMQFPVPPQAQVPLQFPVPPQGQVPLQFVQQQQTTTRTVFTTPPVPQPPIIPQQQQQQQPEKTMPASLLRSVQHHKAHQRTTCNTCAIARADRLIITFFSS